MICAPGDAAAPGCGELWFILVALLFHSNCSCDLLDPPAITAHFIYQDVLTALERHFANYLFLETCWIRQREKILLLKELLKRRCWEACQLRCGCADRQELKPQMPMVKGPSASTAAKVLAGAWVLAESKCARGFI